MNKLEPKWPALCSTLVCAAFRLVELLGPPTASLACQAQVYCGCKPEPTRVAFHPGRMVEEPERQPCLRWTTTHDFEETCIIDVYSCIVFAICLFMPFVFAFFVVAFFHFFHFFFSFFVCCTFFAMFFFFFQYWFFFVLFFFAMFFFFFAMFFFFFSMFFLFLQCFFLQCFLWFFFLHFFFEQCLFLKSFFF